jgi:hypothetical protein
VAPDIRDRPLRKMSKSAALKKFLLRKPFQRINGLPNQVESGAAPRPLQDSELEELRL